MKVNNGAKGKGMYGAKLTCTFISGVIIIKNETQVNRYHESCLTSFILDGMFY